ncbi:kinesin-related protein3 [Zea mays]|uniref:Kinesin-related protein3 n=1 Tax=Zea mays TaxID=4577 RepID=A0A1D6FTP1_MAIZE|nr:kinesin-related protein3 [Zea mays]
MGENGELLISNPFKQGKDGHRMFKFNKVFTPFASQGMLFSDIQPLIRSVLDGFNVCIFAYGQTGSGKTYTMSGPTTSKQDWGVNYRALNDLFDISLSRRNAFSYEVGVQMVEIYNEQVRDLLSNDIAETLGIWNTSQPNGLVVPDASLHSVKSTSDVLDLMEIGQANRAVGSTALNERSSRSHRLVILYMFEGWI